jgi:hypothetical protein
MVREHKLVLYLSVFLLYLIAERVMHGMVTSEFVRKTQLEADQLAAQQIQKTLQPEQLEELVGYEMEVSYQPFRAVGGDYFDVIELPATERYSRSRMCLGRECRQLCWRPTFRLSSEVSQR